MPKCRQRDADQIVDEGPAEILPDCPPGFRRDIECCWNQPQVGPHQGDGRGLARGVRSAGHGYAEIGGSQRRRIVQAVADKGDMAAGASASSRMTSSFSAGSRPARTSLTPASAAMAWAVAWLSPVSMIAANPRRQFRKSCRVVAGSCIQADHRPAGRRRRPRRGFLSGPSPGSCRQIVRLDACFFQVTCRSNTDELTVHQFLPARVRAPRGCCLPGK
jgi:hypothetical protein